MTDAASFISFEAPITKTAQICTAITSEKRGIVRITVDASDEEDVDELCEPPLPSKRPKLYCSRPQQLFKNLKKTRTNFSSKTKTSATPKRALALPSSSNILSVARLITKITDYVLEHKHLVQTTLENPKKAPRHFSSLFLLSHPQNYLAQLESFFGHGRSGTVDSMIANLKELDLKVRDYINQARQRRRNCGSYYFPSLVAIKVGDRVGVSGFQGIVRKLGVSGTKNYVKLHSFVLVETSSTCHTPETRKLLDSDLIFYDSHK